MANLLKKERSKSDREVDKYLQTEGYLEELLL